MVAIAPISRQKFGPPIARPGVNSGLDFALQKFFTGQLNIDDWNDSTITAQTPTFDGSDFVTGRNYSGSTIAENYGLRSAVVIPASSTNQYRIGQNISPTIDMTDGAGMVNKWIALRMKFSAAAFALGPLNVRVRLRSAAHGEVVFPQIFTKNQHADYGRWMTWYINPASIGGNPANMTDIDRIEIHPAATGGELQGVEIKFDWLAIFEIADSVSPTLMLWIDDNATSTPEYCAIADSYGIPLNLGVIKDEFGGAGQYAQEKLLSQIARQRVGHCFCNHSNSLLTADTWATEGYEYKANVMGETSRWLDSLGIGETARVFVVPSGQQAVGDYQLLDRGDLQAIRYAGSGCPWNYGADETRHIYPQPWLNRGYFPCPRLLTGSAASNILSAIDTAIVHRGGISVYQHARAQPAQGGNPEMDIDEWDAFCAAVAQRMDNDGLVVPTAARQLASGGF